MTKINLLGWVAVFFAIGICVVVVLGKVPLQTKLSQDPLLVVDLKKYQHPALPQQLPKQFRLIEQANASASGQFSGPELQALKDAVQQQTSQPVYIVDLRQESHGFINEIPVTWHIEKNRINAGKTNAAILKAEQTLLKGVQQQKEITVFIGRKNDLGIMLPEQSIELAVRDAVTEKVLVEKLGLNYQRFYIADHHRPTDQEVDRFVQWIKSITQTGAFPWLHFHCRGGKGRSTTFITLYDIIQHAPQKSFQDIMDEQLAIGGSNLRRTQQPENRQWKQRPSEARLEFVRKFYDYVVDANGYAQQDWSKWLIASLTKNYPKKG